MFALSLILSTLMFCFHYSPNLQVYVINTPGDNIVRVEQDVRTSLSEMNRIWFQSSDSYLLYQQPNLEVDDNCEPILHRVDVQDILGYTTTFAILNVMRADFHIPSDQKFAVVDIHSTMTHCGSSEDYDDDKPGLDNLNNVGGTSFIVVCPQDYAVFSHELGHALGAVQKSAPHYDANTSPGHTSDAHDIMGVLGDNPKCPTVTIYDCGHDDYYSMQTGINEYLDTHWNITRHRILHAEVKNFVFLPIIQ